MKPGHQQPKLSLNLKMRLNKRTIIDINIKPPSIFAVDLLREWMCCLYQWFFKEVDSYTCCSVCLNVFAGRHLTRVKKLVFTCLISGILPRM